MAEPAPKKEEKVEEKPPVVPDKAPQAEETPEDEKEDDNVVEVENVVDDDVDEVADVEVTDDDVVVETETESESESESPEITPSVTSTEPDGVLLQHWNTMLDIVFADHPSVQSPLRNMPPKIDGNIMKIRVSSSIQQKTLEQQKRDMLEYFRNNYREDIDDIEVEVDVAVETKKVIYGNEDRLDYQRKQNQALDDFLETLNLKLV